MSKFRIEYMSACRRLYNLGVIKGDLLLSMHHSVTGSDREEMSERISEVQKEIEAVECTIRNLIDNLRHLGAR